MSILANQIEIICEEQDLLATLCNITAVLNEHFDKINWVGFYFWKNNELVLGPFQGKIACTHIPYGKGVCGYCAQIQQTVIVDNVHNFKGHIACDSSSLSEIVVPLIYNNQFLGVIDIDAPILNRFTIDDKKQLEEIAPIIAKKIMAYN